MAIRSDIGTLAQPLRWLTLQAMWAAVMTTLRHPERPASREISPLSRDWLVDLERQSIRQRDL